MKKLIKILMALTILLSMGIGLMPDLSVHAASITYHKTFEDAAVELGKGMAAREERIPVGLDMSLAMKLYGDEAAAQKIIENLFQMALKHTGNPKEGDYIKWQYDYTKMNRVEYQTATNNGGGIPKGFILIFPVGYYSTAEQEAELDVMIDELLDQLGVREMSSNYEKMKAIYDYMCSNISLDREHQNNSQYTLQYTAYAALKNKTAACRGFSALLYRLALELGIDSRIIYGKTGGQLHTWNLVKMDDGLYYNLDATYDSTSGMKQCFLKSDATMPNHVRQDEYTTAEFTSQYPTGKTDYFHKEEEIPEVEIPPLKISGTFLSLHHALSIGYKVNSKLFTEGGYSNPYIEFEIGDRTIKVTDYTEQDGYYVFTFVNIAPNQMNDRIYSTLYADYNGTEISSEKRSYSVADYCYNMLSKYSPDQDPNGDYEEFRRLLVDLLHYGSKSQVYTKYNVNDLVDEKLTDEQKQWGTIENPILTNAQDSRYVVIDNPTAIWKGGGVNLSDSIQMRFIFETEQIEGLRAVITSDVGRWEIPASRFIYDESAKRYIVNFSGLHAGQLSEKVYITIYKDETPISNTACYSVESYAYAKQNDKDKELVDLVFAMMKYGNSAKAYIE